MNPIDTAPRDGTDIILISEDGQEAVGKWESDFYIEDGVAHDHGYWLAPLTPKWWRPN